VIAVALHHPNLAAGGKGEVFAVRRPTRRRRRSITSGQLFRRTAGNRGNVDLRHDSIGIVINVANREGDLFAIGRHLRISDAPDLEQIFDRVGAILRRGKRAQAK